MLIRQALRHTVRVSDRWRSLLLAKHLVSQLQQLIEIDRQVPLQAARPGHLHAAGREDAKCSAKATCISYTVVEHIPAGVEAWVHLRHELLASAGRTASVGTALC